MRTFHCDHCEQPVFFENVVCVSCGHQLAYLQDLEVVGSLEPAGDDRWTSPLPAATGRTYRLCANYTEHQVCNWALPDDDPNPLCRSCRLTRVVPDLSQDGNRDLWLKMEVAKRRLVYSLARFGLPIANKLEDSERGLAFEFLADVPGAPVMTGHDGGLITINLAEADDAEREKRRLGMGEPYRTLLGHFRHESGHYYWDRLIADGARLNAFRALFGDERDSYADALQRHYDQGPPADWQERFISTYATSHPWEDWAETWAHYLHITDTLETAADSGLSLRPVRRVDPTVTTVTAATPDDPFRKIVDDWFALSFVLNNLNRGLGLPDGYPFVLSDPVLAKLRFVHDTIREARRVDEGDPAPAVAREPAALR